jgi:hypothetical protein
MAALKTPRHVVEPVEKPEAAPVSLRLPELPIDPSQPGFIWPSAFDHPAFANARGRMTDLFAQRTPANSGVGSESAVRIRNTATEMRTLLSDLVRVLPPMAHVEARKFLERVVFSASQPVVVKVALN